MGRLVLVMVMALAISGALCRRKEATSKSGDSMPDAANCYIDGTLIECDNFAPFDMDTLVQEIANLSQSFQSFRIEIRDSDGPALPLDLFSGYNLTSVYLTNCNFPSMPYDLLSNIESPIVDLMIYENSFSVTELTPADILLPFSEDIIYLEIYWTNADSIAEGMFTQFTNVTYLSLEANNFTKIGLEFLGLKTVRQLHLEENMISAIETGAFRDFQNLQVLILFENQLSNLQEGAFTGLEESPITDIDLSYNPWNCTCELQWLKDWLNERNLTESSFATCSYPEYGYFNDIDFC